MIVSTRIHKGYPSLGSLFYFVAIYSFTIATIPIDPRKLSIKYMKHHKNITKNFAQIAITTTPKVMDK